MKALRVALMLVSALVVAVPAWAQGLTAEELQRRVQELERQVQELKRAVAKPQLVPAPSREDGPSREEVKKLQDAVAALKPGLTNFLLSGYATASFRNEEREKSTFGASFNPLFLWKLHDKLLFEGELELGLEDNETEVNLEYAQLSYFLHDYVTVGAGKFLVPFDMFAERLHPAWINKLPTFPPAFQHHGGIAPFADVGAQVRGGVPLGPRIRANYAVYGANGPRLLTSGHHAGELRFDNTDDNNANKAVGGRIGVLPIPQLELGGSLMYSRVSPEGFTKEVDAVLWGADLSYVRESERIAGRVDLRGEFVLQDIDRATYMEDDEAFDFDNEKWGMYAQVAYRPSLIDVPVLRNFEFVYRFSYLDWPEGTPWPDGADWTQHALGLNYWITPSMVLKLAQELNEKDGSVDAHELFIVELAWGF